MTILISFINQSPTCEDMFEAKICVKDIDSRIIQRRQYNKAGNKEQREEGDCFSFQT